MTSLAPAQPAIVPAPVQQAIAPHETNLSGALHLPQLHSLALQIQHNLRFQHQWSGLHVHTHSPLTHEPLPRPLVSGLPPQRIYIHPDEQVELLREADRRRKADRTADGGGLQVQAEPEREWILPTRLNEKWTLRRLAQVFDGITPVPPAPAAATPASHRPDSPWRATKRVLLATADSDSTVTYYIVHDGVVKPRQN